MMIIKSIPGGDSSNIINYICKNSTAKDKEILSGNPNLSKHIIDNSKFKQNYYHFTLSENGRTDITKEHWEVILNVFKKEFFHGYDEKEVNSLSVLHDKEHIHIAVPTMNLLSGKGNYYYNDRTDRKRINLIRDLIHKIDFTDYGLKDIKLREPS
ncbi:MAG: hypothetical protein U9Q83_01835, partial [Bacteroidota bacterium]|nr:hypothetical protein [Bacteroidota bacterium]